MLAKIVQIGSSKGIRIPKAVLEQCHFLYEVKMKVDKKRLIIEPIQNLPRQGWKEIFKADKKQSKKKEKAGYISTKFDKEEWEW
jgi:antitoxin MazE